VHGSRHPELAEVNRLVTAIADDLEPHMLKEEQILFPAITHRFGAGSPAAPGSLAAPIRVMEADHEVVGTLLERLRTTTGGYAAPADGCASYQALYARLADLETDTFRHVHLENNVLFPQVLAAA
jgi:regulator of cell morphogenesis and NO signaling